MVNPRDHMPLLLRGLVDRGARVQPDNLIVTKLGEGYHTVTFREHQVRSRKLASALDRHGIRIGDRVGSLMWNSASHLECYHATACMGVVLHTANLRLGPKDLGHCIKHAQDRVIFADHDLLKLLAKVDANVLTMVELYVVVGEDGVAGKFTVPSEIPSARVRDYVVFLETGDACFEWPDFPETALHALCYTSGTTGDPKAVGYSHRSTYLHTLAADGADALGISGAHVVLPFVPMFHVLSWGVPFIGLTLGTRMIMSGRFMDPASTLQCMLDWEVQISTGVPTVWQGLKAVIEKKGIENVRKDLKIKLLTCGGSAPPHSLIVWYRENLGVEFLQGWGMTETNPVGCMGRSVAKFKDLNASREQLVSNIAKAGLPLPGVDVRIANPDNLDEDVPSGGTGELLCRGPWVIAEYFMHNAPDKFHKGWLITGDVAKIDEEGAVVITDRSKDVIKSGGEWISSIDLENHITAMPDVSMAAVVAVPHPKWEERPIAIVTLSADVHPGVGEELLRMVHAHCLKTFAKFQLPDDVLVWEAIPLTTTGKIDKKIIRQRLKQEGYTLPALAKATSAGQ